MTLGFADDAFHICIFCSGWINLITQGPIFEILPYICRLHFYLFLNQSCYGFCSKSWDFLIIISFSISVQSSIVNHAILSSSLWHGFSLFSFCDFWACLNALLYFWCIFLQMIFSFSSEVHTVCTELFGFLNSISPSISILHISHVQDRNSTFSYLNLPFTDPLISVWIFII